MSDVESAQAHPGADESRSAAGNRNPWLIAVVVSIATFMEVLDTSIANVALSHIAGALAANEDESRWVLTSYLVASAVALPISGWLSGVIGRKRFYMLCVGLFTASSFLCGNAPNLQSLIVFRVLQGLGGGGMAPSEQSMLADTFPPEKRAQAFALYGLAVIVAPTVGPAIGGYLTDNWSWHWIFLINVPIGAVSLVLVSWLVSEPEALERERRERLKGRLKVDFFGFVLVALWLGCLEIVLDKGQEDDWFASDTIRTFAAISFVSMLVLFPWEYTRKDPIFLPSAPTQKSPVSASTSTAKSRRARKRAPRSRCQSPRTQMRRGASASRTSATWLRLRVQCSPTSAASSSGNPSCADLRASPRTTRHVDRIVFGRVEGMVLDDGSSSIDSRLAKGSGEGGWTSASCSESGRCRVT